MIKNPPANAEETRVLDLILGLGRSPGGGYGNPSRIFAGRNLMDREARQASVHGGLFSFYLFPSHDLFSLETTQFPAVECHFGDSLGIYTKHLCMWVFRCISIYVFIYYFHFTQMIACYIVICTLLFFSLKVHLTYYSIVILNSFLMDV